MKIYVKNENELISAIKNNSNCEVVIKEGEYFLEETLFVNSNTTVTGEGDVKLFGSKRVEVSGDGIIKIDLKENGITDFGKFGLGPYEDFWRVYDIPKPHLLDEGPSLQLFYEGKTLELSRYPKNDKFIKIKKALGETEQFFRDEHSGSLEGIFIPAESEIFEKENISNLLLSGYWNVDWAIQRHEIESFDKNTGVIKVKEPYHTFGYRDGKCFTDEIGGKFCVLNAKSAITNPGEWCIDREEGCIYLYLIPGQKYVDISVCENVFEAKEKENIKISGLKISQTRKCGVHFENVNNSSVESCEIYNVGAWAIINDNCNKCRCLKNKIYNTGGGGIASNGGNRNQLIKSENLIAENEIFSIALWHRTYLAAVELNGVGVTVSENHIHDIPHFAIVYQGNEHIIERNEIDNACFESNDAGAIYCGRDYTCRGNIIRYNYIHDLLGFEGYGCIGIYFDDGVCTAEVYGNILANIPYIGILIGGGRDFDIHDNKFFNCNMTINLDDRLTRWKSGNKRHIQHLNEVDYRNDIWKKAYPSLYNILDDEPLLPKYNKFYNNEIVGGLGITYSKEYIKDLVVYENNTYIPFKKEQIKNNNMLNWYFIEEHK